MLDQQRAPTTQSTPTHGDTSSSSGNTSSVSAAQGSDDWLHAQSDLMGNSAFQGMLSGEEESQAAPDYKSMPANTRGGFAARLLAAVGSSGSPEDVLSSGQYERPATRAEAAVIMARVLGLGETLKGQPAVFTDLPLSHWAAASVYRCQEEGLFAGRQDGSFGPDEALNEGAAGTLVQRAANPGSRVAFKRSEAVDASNEQRELPEGQGEVDGPMKSTKGVYNKHKQGIADAKLDLSDGSHAWTMNYFKKTWEANKARYEKVAAQVNIPAPLIAALHMREASGKFNTYLHQGDPLGRPAVHHPKNIPIFHVWEDAAVHALNMKGYLRDDLGMDAQTTDMAAMATFAEHYNGLGYHNKGRVSPYVYAGTDQYKSGKYVADGVFDPNAKDKQLGVVAMLQGIGAGQPGPGTLVEGQIAREGNPVANAQVVITDAKGQRFETTASAKGFFSLDDGAAAGRGTIEVEGVKQPVDIGAGGASWTSFHLDSPAPMPEPDAPEQQEAPSVRLELGGKLLRRGSKGQLVRTLQEMLKASGADITVDGDFGPGTERAVKAFQSSKGLSADGVVGNQTAEALNSAASRSSGSSQQTGGQTSGGQTSGGQQTGGETSGGQQSSGQGATSSPLSGLKGTLRRGAKGDMVKALQERLNAHGANITVDGDFGPGTERAVKAFQTLMGLSVDGVVGSNTVAKLIQAPGQLPASGGQQQQGGSTSGGSDVPATEGTAGERGAMAAKSARIEYLRGRDVHGSGSWETQGTNQGPLVNEFKQSNRAGANSTYAWCGMFVGHNYKKAGIRDEILRNLVFWSGLRLHKFFTEGSYVATSQARAGSWWKPHQTTSLKGLTGSRRKAALDEFGPQEGDIALFRNDYSHVAIVTGYNRETGELQLIEGNRGNKVQATAYGTGDSEITFLGRFNDADFGGETDSALNNAKNPVVNHSGASGGSTR
ncbi:MAG: peptidoglycan-binding protein [Alphaproteobacteria bacterium]|nr:peptidoglycan-binding protein [Alphaproteobacteria bacterium]